MLRFQIMSRESQITGISLSDLHIERSILKPKPLSPVIESLIYSPHSVSAKRLEDFTEIHRATMYDSNAPELGKTWETLDIALKNPSLETQTRAFFLAAGLLYQTSLPQQERALWQTFVKMRKEMAGKDFTSFQRRFLLQKEEITDPNKTLMSIKQSVETFRQRFESSEKAPESEEKAHLQINVLDQYLKTALAYSLYFKFGMDYCDPELFESLIASIFKFLAGKSEGFKTGLYQKLLVEGKIEDAAEELRGSLFLNSWQIEKEDEESPDELKKRLYKYFIDHPELQVPFWERFTSKQKLQVLGEIKNSAIQAEIEKSFKNPPEVSILKNLLSLEEQTVNSFFSTIPDGYSQKPAFIRKLIGVFALSKSSPDSLTKPGVKAFAAYLDPILEEGKLSDAFKDEYKILYDQIPGAIFVNTNGEARARVAKPGQTPLNLYEMANKERVSVAYLSKAQFDQTKTEETKEEESGFCIENGEIRNADRWGQVQVPSEQTMPGLFTHLAKALPSSLNEDNLYDLTAQYQEKAGKNGSLAVLPQLLDKDHSFFVLAKMGIIGVLPTENGVQFIIDAKLAKIATIGPDKIAVAGQFNRIGDLEIEGLEQYTPLHYLLSAASYLTKTSGTERALTRDEVAQIRGRVKDWNKKLPEIVFDPSTPPVTGDRIILPIGKKVVYLAFV